ncbi:decaprenyl-phosphate phosphoribosyltransferase [Denitratisoma sp. DHT3]|uniref:decaprenyl-phosphate phosphoribosyltransferase n=1 Tax=Denitratisoma sp. DHT3 TaxID=1981880 RepID=UPI0011988DF3|nr:decaprenyl-phosphate phosphoribosyltransferase [Denitratisoma sp. DHT3]QDX81271.1 decaprenyl-phosphate phosphoribosyltransferase [Denitratisoma sp. DHT3]
MSALRFPPLAPLFALLRPHQWIKNGFVLVGLLFGHAWHDAARLQQGLWAFLAFCLLSSSVYVFNDLRDREQDRQHPRKRRRPLAAGTVGVPAAVLLLMVCLAGGLALAFSVAGRAPWVFVAYLVLNVGYSLGLKHVVVLDVFLIAAGFMLRLLAGTLGLDIAPSLWLLLCGLMLTLFLGFAKRRAELAALAAASGGHRRVLEDYSEALLDQFITIAAACTVVTYSLYTVSAETVALHGSSRLMLTVPFVLYGMLRYLFLLHRRQGGGDVAREVLTDPHLILAVLAWLATVLAVLTGRL